MKFGEFEAIRKVGAGGMGTVWEVRHPNREQSFAAKVAMHARSTLPEFRQRFEREVRAMARLRHPNVVRVFDYGVYFGGPAPDAPQNGTPWVVLEFATGGELEPEEVDSWDKLRVALDGLLRGLAHSHSRGLIHRDVKPQNLLWVERRGQLVPAVADFGIAHALDRHRPTTVEHFTNRNAEEATGTPRYMAPEQFMGTWRDYGPQTDLYSTGILAYYLTCKRAPYKGQNLYQYAAKHMNEPFPELDPQFDVPEHFEDWVRWLTQKQAVDRPPSAFAALERLLEQPRQFASAWTEAAPDDEPGRAPVGVGLFGLNRTYLVGRENERESLWKALERAQREPVAVEMHGPSGVGKSRLARWVTELALERDYVGESFTAHFSPDRPATAGLSWMLAQHMRCVGLTAESLDERLDLILPDDWEPEAHQAMAQVLSQAESVATDVTSPTVRNSMVVEMTRRWMLHHAANRPIVIHLDDIDEDVTGQARSLVAALGESSAPILILMTAQTAQNLGEELEVDVLEEASFKRLLRDELGLPVTVSEQVERLADGNPQFALQLLGHWIDSGQLTPNESGELVLEAADIPSTLENLWSARVAGFTLRLDDDAIAVAVAAGVLGSPVAPSEWLATASELGVDIESPLFGEVSSAMIENGIGIWDSSDRMRLSHRTLGDLLARAGGDSMRKRAHGAAARALSSLYSSSEQGLTLRVAQHFREGGSPQLAMIALEPALAAALDVVDSAEIGEVAQSILDTLDAMEVPDDSPKRHRARAYRAIEWVMSARDDDRERAAAWLDEALAASADAPKSLAAEIQGVAAWSAISRGGREEAAELLEQLVADEAVNERTRYMNRMFLTHLYTYLHDGDAVRRHAVVTIKSDVAPPAWKLRAREALIHVALAARDADNAKQHAFPALILAKQLKRMHLEVHMENLSGFIADLSEDFAAAESHHARSERLASIVQPQSGVRLMAREYRARAMVHQGKFKEAFDLLWSLADEVEAGRAPGVHPWDALLASSVALGREDGEQRAWVRAIPARPNALHIRSIRSTIQSLESHDRHDEADRFRAEVFPKLRDSGGIRESDLVGLEPAE